MSEENNKYNKPLTEKQNLFVEAYLLHPNAYKAAVTAGFAKSTADKKAPLWVGKDREKCPENYRHVWDAYYKARETRSEETKIDAKFILTRLAAMANADPTDIIDEETGAYKRIHDWPIVWRRMLSAADVQEIWESQGQGQAKKKIGEIIKYKFVDVLKLHELLGKHVNVNAYREHKQITGSKDGPVHLITTEMSPDEATDLYKSIIDD